MSERFQRVFGIIAREVSLQHFERFVLQSSDNTGELFSAIKQCRTHGFPRFNIWRMLLEVMPIQAGWEHKKQALQSSRKRWGQLKEEAKTGVSVASPTKELVNVPKNPLMKMVAKPEKKEVPPDSFLKTEIKKDVDRTYQQMQFFQDGEILKLMEDVLFVWCKINSDISYIQGMNEVLASIIYVYFKEAVPSNFEASNDTETKYLFMNSLSYSEADIYSVFEKIMSIQKDMFQDNLDDEMKGRINPNSKNNSPILQRIVALMDQRLKSIDLELFRIIKLQDVKTKTFLLRWIRCMHTREFELHDSFLIWDSIFLDAFESPLSKNKKQFQFVDAMCLGMFIYMRAIVVTRQTANQILQVYSKYPRLQGTYLNQLLRLAWSVCEELRNQAANPGNGSNWFEDSKKVKKLGLMEKGVDPLVRKKPAESQSKSKQVDSSPVNKNIINNEAKIQKEVKNGDSSSKNEASPVAADKRNDEEAFLRPDKSPFKKEEEAVRKSSGNGKFQMQEDELRDLIETLKQSINLNKDTQSRALSNKVLKSLESKLRK